MWPLTAGEICEAIGAQANAPSEERFDGVATRGPGRKGDLLVALGVDGRDPAIGAYFEAGGGLAIVRPGAVIARYADRSVVVDDPLAAFGALAASMRQRFSFPVIAIGGANGKTTLKEMARAALGGAYRVTATPGTENGHYGVPLTLLDRAHAIASPPHALVIEIGIDAIGAMAGHAVRCAADVAVIASLGEEHLRGLRDASIAAREERALFDAWPRARRIVSAFEPGLAGYVEGARAGDVVVRDAAQEGDDALLAHGVSLATCAIAPFDGTGRTMEARWRSARDGKRAVTLRVPLPGEHHARLAALAAATAFALGRTVREIEEGFRAFHPPASRASLVPLARGLTLIDDAFNANPSSVVAALAILDEAVWASRPKAIVLGDMLDLGAASEAAHLALAPHLAKLDGAHVRLYGDAMKATHDALRASNARFASLGHLAASRDPVGLLDGAFTALEGAVCLVKGSRGMRLERVCAALRKGYARPRAIPARPSFADDIATVGVTGTNGKSTTTTWIAAALARAHRPVARATTLGYYLDDEPIDQPFDFDGFARALGIAHARGARVAALEVTSEALRNGFAKLWPFRVGVFTNLTHDHLDVHGSHEHYLASKAQLFTNLPDGGTAVLNAADPASALLREILPAGVTLYTYGVASRGALDGDVDLVASSSTASGHVTRIALARSSRLAAFPESLVIRAVGDVYVENALAAALGAFAAGVPIAAIEDALARTPPPAGRFEIVAERPYVVIDYAHTPDALARTLAAARSLSRGRVLLVFGAGGDRDREKRAPMGRAASLADQIYVTTDNPRSEDPMKIARDVLVGAGERAVIELDRAIAIDAAIAAAGPDDVVLVCGKGHETTQTIGGATRPFSDRDVALAAWKRAACITRTKVVRE